MVEKIAGAVAAAGLESPALLELVDERMAVIGVAMNGHSTHEPTTSACGGDTGGGNTLLITNAGVLQDVTGYIGRNSVSFRVPTERSGEVLDAVVKAGATEVDGLEPLADAVALNFTTPIFAVLGAALFGSGAALVAAATLSDRYISDRFLPDKAVDLVDEAASRLRIEIDSLPTEIDVVQTFVDQCVLLHNAGKLSAELAAEAKLKASELESHVMDECVQLHGGAGYMSEYRISHMFTDARVSRIYAGSSEIMKEIIARGLGLDERKLTG